jgi:hypothetical protein
MRNQFVFCTHSPDIISATLDQSVIFIAPKKDRETNQAIEVKEDDETNQALRLLGHSIGIVALGKKIVLIEGQNSSLDKQTYGSLLKAKFPELVLVPTGGKQSVQAFGTSISNVLEKTLWGVEFFMLCDGDAAPRGLGQSEIETRSKGRLRVLPRYHLENYFLNERVLAKAFSEMEPEDSWLRDPTRIRETLRELARPLLPYTVALQVSRRFRLEVGNIDIMPKNCHALTPDELQNLLMASVGGEKERVIKSLDEGEITTAVKIAHTELEDFIEKDDDRWKAKIPGKALLAQFASKANIPATTSQNIVCATCTARGTRSV